MLKVREIRDDGANRTVFRLFEDEATSDSESLERLAAISTRLLVENDLPGTFRVGGPGELVLEVAASGRHFLHDGIVFAALDAVNDPVRNPTLTLFADREPPV